MSSSSTETRDRADSRSAGTAGSPPWRSGSEPAGEGPPPSAARSLTELAVVVLAVVVAAVATHTTDVLLVVVALVVMVMLHEFGHFITAKWSHMKVTEYFFGFGPRLWSVRKGETEYGIKALPLGGYVKIPGMSNVDEVDDSDEPRTYRQQPFRKRLLVVSAGSLMHGLIAFLLIFCFFAISGVPSSSVVEVQGIAPLSRGVDPAQAAGIRPGDVVKSVDGTTITSVTQMVDLVEARPGQKVSLVVDRNGKDTPIVVTPVPVSVNGKSEGRIGVLLATGSVSVGPWRALGRAGVGLGDTVTATFGALGQIFSAHGLTQLGRELTNTKAAQASEHSTTRLQSIYGAVRTTTQALQAGWGDFVAVFASINVFIGIVNMLPMLPLDGGHVAIAVYERIRSRRGRRYHADVRKMAPLAYVFITFLGFIAISALYLDITHPVSNPFH